MLDPYRECIGDGILVGTASTQPEDNFCTAWASSGCPTVFRGTDAHGTCNAPDVLVMATPADRMPPVTLRAAASLLVISTG